MTQPFQLCPNLNSLNAKERLNYVLGQVLGVKDFQQEQKYFLHKSQLQNRGLHGYGTVWGLDITTSLVSEEDSTKGTEVKVSPGFAIDPLGREVTIDALQCANLTDWLAAAAQEKNSSAPEESLKTNLDTLTGSENQRNLYVTLCYRTCETGAQPILGNPCRIDSDKDSAIAYTRLRDDFELQLRAAPPKQPEEDRIRAIAALFSKINIVPDSEIEESKIEERIATLRAYLELPFGEPIESVDLPQSSAQGILKDLLRYWVTNIRPTVSLDQSPLLSVLRLLEVDPSATPDERKFQNSIEQLKGLLDRLADSNSTEPALDVETIQLTEDENTRLQRVLSKYWLGKVNKQVEDDCLLLAEITLQLNDDGTIDESSFAVENNQRPYLLQTRLLQELALEGNQLSSAPQNAPSITIGSVTTGAPTDQASVVASDPGPNVTLDFVIPRGQPGSSTPASEPPSTKLIRNIFQPNLFLLEGEEEGIPFATDGAPVLSNINGYPSLIFSRGAGSAVFSTLRPLESKPGQTPRLYVHCASKEEIELSWFVAWRWKKSIGTPPTNVDNPGERIHSLDDNNAGNFSQATVTFPLIPLADLRLQRSNPLALSINKEIALPESDYLSVYLKPNVEEGKTDAVYLLMAELVWGEEG